MLDRGFRTSLRVRRQAGTDALSIHLAPHSFIAGARISLDELAASTLRRRRNDRRLTMSVCVYASRSLPELRAFILVSDG